MTHISSKELFAEFKGNPPASEGQIARCQLDLKFPLPPDYVRFLQCRNGGEGFVGKNYLMAWRVEKLLDHNKAYMVDEFVPDLFLFGSNGGGEAFAFDTRSTPVSIVMVPFILSLTDAITLAPSFDLFLQLLYRADSLIQSTPESQVNRR
jgi:hypothetical protein